jgi:hypothetical protein
LGEKTTGAVLIALAIKRKFYTTMKQKRKDDVKSISITRTHLSVRADVPKLQTVIIYYEDVKAEQPQLHQRQQRSLHSQREFVWISPRLPRNGD